MPDPTVPQGGSPDDTPYNPGQRIAPPAVIGNFVNIPGYFGIDASDGMSKEEWYDLGTLCFGTAAIFGGVVAIVLRGRGGAQGIALVSLWVAMGAYCWAQVADPPQEDYRRVIDLTGLSAGAVSGSPFPWSAVERELRALVTLVPANLDAIEREQGARAAGDLEWSLTHAALAMVTSSAIRRVLERLAHAVDRAADSLRGDHDLEVSKLDTDAATALVAQALAPGSSEECLQLARGALAAGGLASARLAEVAWELRNIARRGVQP